MNLLRFTLIAGLTSPLLVAQPVRRPTPAAELEWQRLIAAVPEVRGVSPAQREPPSNSPGSYRQSEKNKSTVLAAAELAEVTRRVNEFTQRFPVESRAPEARKLEAWTALHADWSSARDREAAQKIVRGFANDRSLSAEDRLDIALPFARREITSRSNRKKGRPTLDEQESVADGLFRDFGGVSRVSVLYRDILNTAGPERLALARRIAKLDAGKEAISAAKAFLHRQELIGKKFTPPLFDEHGVWIPATNSAGGRTIIHFTGPTDTVSVVAEPGDKTRRVHVLVGEGSTTAPMDTSMMRSRVTGFESFPCMWLRIRTVPFYVVTDAGGIIVAWGGDPEQSASLATALKGGGK